MSKRNRDLKNQGANIIIGIPSLGHWEADFGMSLVAMTRRVCGNTPKSLRGIGYNVISSRGTILSQVRQDLLRNALRVGATHILWLDDDMTFPPTTLERLWEWNKPFVAGVGVIKDGSQRLAATVPGGDRVQLDGPGLVKVNSVGLAVALVDLEFVKPMLPPHFEMSWVHEARGYSGEDTAFCRKWQAAGHEIWVDKGLSREIGHIGKHVYRPDTVVEAQAV